VERQLCCERLFGTFLVISFWLATTYARWCDAMMRIRYGRGFARWQIATGGLLTLLQSWKQRVWWMATA
jgi:hypothetical protein